jgi:hypothetical protein
VLILAPTRELAMQIAGVLEAAGAPLGLATLCAYGGVPKPPQASNFSAFVLSSFWPARHLCRPACVQLLLCSVMRCWSLSKQALFERKWQEVLLSCIGEEPGS